MTKAFATERSAHSEAIDLVTTMVNDSGLETAGDWEKLAQSYGL
jgi:hypothetical protein